MALLSDPLLAGAELGGTKCIAVLARGRTIIAREQIATRDPDSTLRALSRRLVAWQAEGAAYLGLGIASFGPLSLNRKDPDFGRIGRTPKPGWSGCDLLGAFKSLGVPIVLDTDVNGAALAEGLWGAAKGSRAHVYLTIGTGVGGGLVAEGQLVHGRMHAEMGHVRVRRRPGDTFAGICPFHGDCLEGLVSGPAIAARSGRAASDLPSDDPIWDMVGAELGEMIASLLFIVAPDRILIGGGVGRRPDLLRRIQDATLRMTGSYRPAYHPGTIGDIVRPPELGEDAGPLGAIALALRA